MIMRAGSGDMQSLNTVTVSDSQSKRTHCPEELSKHRQLIETPDIIGHEVDAVASSNACEGGGIEMEQLV